MNMLLLKTWRDIMDRKGQFIALMMLVALGMTSYVAFISAYYDLKASADRAAEELRFASFSTQVVSAPSAALRRIREIPGVQQAEGRLVMDTGLDLADGEQATARVVGLAMARLTEVNRVVVLQGTMPRPRADDEVLLNSKFANETGMAPGDRLTLRINGEPRTVRITGIASSPEYLYPIRSKGELPSPKEFAVVFADQEQVERWFGKPGAINDVAVLLEPDADTALVVDRVEKILDPYEVLDSVARADQPSNTMLQSEIGQNRTMAQFMPILILIISSSSLYIAMSRLVQSQRGEIGLMKALGYTDGQVLVHYVLFALFIAVGGSVIGMVLGQLGAWWFAQLYVDMLGIPYMASNIHWDVMAQALLISAAACLVAGILPAWASARITPAKAMHSDPNASVTAGRKPLIERLFGWAMPRSFTFRIPIRNIFRSRRRSLYTIVGIAFAMVLTVATWSLFDAVDFMMNDVFERSERWDVIAAFERPFGDSRVHEVQRIGGVKTVEPALYVPAEITANGKTQDSMITAMAPASTFHGYKVTGGMPAEKALSRGGLVMAAAVAKKLGVRPGDTVSVKTPYTDDPKPYKVMTLTDETLGGPVFASTDVGRRLMATNRTEYNALYLDVEPQRADAIRKELYDLPGASQVQVKVTLRKNLMAMMEFMTVFGGIMLGFGFAMAAAVIYNTFTTNVLERMREIATMRTIGEGNGRVAVMITIENVLLALVAMPLGVWLGLMAAQALYDSFSTEAYSFQAVIYPSSVAAIVVVNIAVLLLSEIPPIRRVSKMDLGEATKVME
jgi:putative ABC transport system permease protein